MLTIMKKILTVLCTFALSGCSVFGESGVEVAPYTVLKTASDTNIELRHYDSLVLVTTPMNGGMDNGQNAAFGRLFKYISGENIDQSKIAMTAPVFMSDEAKSEGQKIAMTAPVFMGNNNDNFTMSFVLPATMTIDTAPLPTNKDVTLEEIKNYKVAAIKFSGYLNQDTIDAHKMKLENWINANGYKATGQYKSAGYNPPFTIPALRRNEVMIPIKQIKMK